jgi:hypothetical protein
MTLFEGLVISQVSLLIVAVTYYLNSIDKELKRINDREESKIKRR